MGTGFTPSSHRLGSLLIARIKFVLPVCNPTAARPQITFSQSPPHCEVYWARSQRDQENTRSKADKPLIFFFLEFTDGYEVAAGAISSTETT